MGAIQLSSYSINLRVEKEHKREDNLSAHYLKAFDIHDFEKQMDKTRADHESSEPGWSVTDDLGVVKAKNHDATRKQQTMEELSEEE